MIKLGPIGVSLISRFKFVNLLLNELQLASNTYIHGCMQKVNLNPTEIHMQANLNRDLLLFQYYIRCGVANILHISTVLILLWLGHSRSGTWTSVAYPGKQCTTSGNLVISLIF